MKLRIVHFQHMMIGLTLSSCVLFDSKRPPQDFTQTNEIKTEDEVIGCDLPNFACSQPLVISPYVCRAKANTPEQQLGIGWGDSLCLAKRNLMQDVCNRFETNILDDNLECLPDPSQGECQHIERMAKKNEVKSPTVCFSKTYNNKELVVSNIIIGWGESSEDASFKLKFNACSRGLKPSLIGNIECHSEESKKCPPKDDNCEKDGLPSVCHTKSWQMRLSENHGRALVTLNATQDLKSRKPRAIMLR